MESFEFSIEEIREQLERLGHHNITPERLVKFKDDLERLVSLERTKDSSASASLISESVTDSEDSDAERHRHIHIHIQPSSSHSIQSNLNQPTTSHATHVSQDSGPARQPVQRAFTEYTRRDVNNLADTSIASSNSDRRFIKRRVARKVDGHSMISDELTESEYGDNSSVEERLGHLDLESGPYRNRWDDARPYQEGHIKSCLSRRPQSAEPVFRLPEDYDGPTSLIRPMAKNPHTRNIRKSDPVSRYQQYNECWQSQRAPGEKMHKHLRWNVREQMLYHDEVVQRKPKKVYVPNSYVIPSDKKRKNLRWAVRQDMAQGVVPPSMFD